MKVKRKQRWLALFMVLAVLIGIFPMTAFAEGHVHADSCYAKEGDLLCPLEEVTGHTHTEDCYCAGGEYICGYEEAEGDQSNDCYECEDDTDTLAYYGEDERMEHVHVEDCICSGGELICNVEESEGHTHSDDCFAKGGELICGYEEISLFTGSTTALRIEASDYSSLLNAVQTITDSEQKEGTIVITADMTLEKHITVPDGVSITLTDDGSKHTITTPLLVAKYQTDYDDDTVGLIEVEKGGKLTIDGDLALEANTNNVQNREDIATWIIKCHGIFVLENGIIDGNNRYIRTISLYSTSSLDYHNSGLVVVCGRGAEFEMNGGAIQNARINSEAGGVKICCNGKFTMNDGTIKNIDSEKRATAGAVLVYSNTSTNYSYGKATFIMNGGIIENNRGYRGAGVHVCGPTYTYRSTFEMNGGTIRNNTAIGIQSSGHPLQGGGAGVYVEKNATFTMNDGTITDNTVYLGQGGGVCAICGWSDVASSWGSQGWTVNSYSYYYPAAVTMNGGIISNNTVHMTQAVSDNGCGGGIYLASNCVTLNSGTIENNNAEKQGGGVYVSSTPYVLKMKNAVISDNTASVIGGGLWACPTGSVEVFVTNGAAFYDNSAGKAGDDLASVKNSSDLDYTLNLPSRVLGGGQALWYKDGGILVNSSVPLGKGDESPRYDASDNAELLNSIKNFSSSLAAKSVLSEASKKMAADEATVFIRGNTSARGGGIGTNGSVVIGDKNYDYKLVVKKEWADLESDSQKTPVTVFLKSGSMELGSAELSEANNWTATFTELPDPATLGSNNSYTVVENPVPDGFVPTYSNAEINNNTRTIEISITNTYQAVATGSLTIKKEISGNGIPDANAVFEFTVTKDGTAAVGKYAIGSNAAQAIPTDGKICLKAGESAVLTELAIGEYTVTETTPTQTNYESTSFSVNNQPAQAGLAATVSVTAITAASSGGWRMKNGSIEKDSDGYFVYTITRDQMDVNGKITVDCDPLAEYMETAMRSYQNFSSCKFKVKFVNETGTAIAYQDYNFDTVNWLPVGATYTPSADPAMLDTDDGADDYSAGYGWGEAWQKIYPMLSEENVAEATLNVEGFDGNDIRLSLSPLRCINPAIISYFESNSGYGTLTGDSTTSSASYITLLQMNAFPELIKQAFTFRNYQGEEISLDADSSRTYADFLCAFYGVSSLDQLTVAQKYNVLGTGYKGSPSVKKGGQANISTYYSSYSGKLENRCVPYSALRDGSLDYFKTWGLSEQRIAVGKKLASGGTIFSSDDADTYAYQPNYYLLESDSDVLKMAYEYLYDRCIRITFDHNNRAVSTAWDDSDTPTEDVSGVKSYIDKTSAAKANVLTAMNNGNTIADQEAIVLDNVRGYIEVPNAWSVFRCYDFGFELIFKADTTPTEPQAASVVFTNNYKTSPTPSPDPSNKNGSLKVSKTVSGNAASTAKEFTFTVALDDQSLSGTYGDMVFENGIAVLTLKADESKTARNLPAGTAYTVAESDNEGYSVTVNGENQTVATGTVIANSIVTEAFNNHKSTGGDTTPDPDPEPQPVPAKVTITAQKTVDGVIATGSDYSFILKDDTGNVIQTVRNDGGNITFAALSFTKTGTYIYTLSEAAGTDKGINYDDSIYKIIINITKHGDYSASVSYEKGENAYSGIPVFANTTKPSEDKNNTVTVTVSKVWNDNNYIDRPATINVQLYKNGIAYGNFISLNAATNWQHTWSDLDKSANWTVDEVTVPDGYSKTVAHSGNKWTITNTRNSPPTTPPGKPFDKVPQTDDSSNIEFWTFVAFLSLVLMGTMAFGKKRRSVRK